MSFTKQVTKEELKIGDYISKELNNMILGDNIRMVIDKNTAERIEDSVKVSLLDRIQYTVFISTKKPITFEEFHKEIKDFYNNKGGCVCSHNCLFYNDFSCLGGYKYELHDLSRADIRRLKAIYNIDIFYNTFINFINERKGINGFT